MAVYGYVELCMAMDVGVCLCSRMYARIDLFVQITRDVSWGIHGLLTQCRGPQSRAQSFSGSLSAVGRRDKLWDVLWDQEGGVNSTARAYPMILAIVTSRSVKRGILLGFENGAGDVVGC